MLAALSALAQPRKAPAVLERSVRCECKYNTSGQSKGVPGPQKHRPDGYFRWGVRERPPQGSLTQTRRIQEAPGHYHDSPSAGDSICKTPVENRGLFWGLNVQCGWDWVRQRKGNKTAAKEGPEELEVNLQAKGRSEGSKCALITFTSSKNSLGRSLKKGLKGPRAETKVSAKSEGDVNGGEEWVGRDTRRGQRVWWTDLGELHTCRLSRCP